MSSTSERTTRHPLVRPEPASVLRAPRGRRRWGPRLRGIVIAADVAVVLVGAALAVVLGVSERPEPWAPSRSIAIAAVVVAVSLGALAASRCWARRVLLDDTVQVRGVVTAFTGAALLLALGGLAIKVDAVRPWVFGVLPVIALGVLSARWTARAVLHRSRTRGRCLSTVLVIGPLDAAGDLIVRTRRAPEHGWAVTAVCTSTRSPCAAAVQDVPVVGGPDDVAHQVLRRGVDIVAVTTGSGCSPAALRRLAWQLEGTGAELAVDPGLTEVPGGRLRVSAIDGLPMLRVAEVRFTGAARLAKNLLDRVLAALLLVVLAPLLAAVAVAVARDGGPVLYRQERVGLRGRPFPMVKFRTMVVGADRLLDGLRATNDGAGPLFKMRSDPRVTRVGATLRRLSLDELPQLLNVAAGSMSLVGPRPALPHEVSAYCDDDLRRLAVRPGITGLWQISGRSNLSWEDSVRLDLRYVENWSPCLDAAILWRTVGAVLRQDGAY